MYQVHQAAHFETKKHTLRISYIQNDWNCHLDISKVTKMLKMSSKIFKKIVIST
jgi:hypothetical protein